MISALRAAIEKIPTRKERLGGQTFKYVKLSEVLDLLDTFRSSNADETSTSRNARRYSVISRCIAPKDLYDRLVSDGKSPGEWVDLPREQSIQQKIDDLCDAALQRSPVEPK